MEFLKKFFNIFPGFLHINNSNLVSENEIISRYLFQQKGKFSVDKKTVKHRAFLPPPNNEMSVYRTSNLTEDFIWNIGGKYVAEPQGKECLARAELLKSIYTSNSLDVIPDTDPHPLHAKVVNWPNTKHERQLIASKLSVNSTLVLNLKHYQ